MSKHNFSMREVSESDAQYVAAFYAQNIDALHAIPITLREWERVLAETDPDEAHYLICVDDRPVAWMKINNLSSADTVWLSMLAVDPAMHRQGIGRFAVLQFEAIARAKGFRAFAIQTTADNTPARALYKACGYAETTREDRCYYRKTL